MKRLVLLRHAKSSWSDPSLADFDRPLNKRGKRDAPAMGLRLANLGIDPDQIISSPAKRARRTATAVAAALDFPREEIEFADAIYGADCDTLLDIVRGLGNADEVLLVGHNPGFTDLGNMLTDSPIDNLPTCGVVILDFDVSSWSQVGLGDGLRVAYDSPKRAPG